MNIVGPTILIALVLAHAAPLRAQESASTETAHQLVRALERSGQDAIAIADPQAPGTFVAALYVSGGQLLVISAHHPARDALAERIARREYRAAFLVLQQTPTRKGKFFVMDVGADGIRPPQPDSREVDVAYEDDLRQTRFDGRYTSQRLTAAAYQARLAETDARYARLLGLLVGALGGGEPPLTSSR